MLKLVFTDLDGTFVDSQKLVPERNAYVLDLAAERGVQFVPCTGRNANGILPELANHPAVRYAICCAGAIVFEVSGVTISLSGLAIGSLIGIVLNAILPDKDPFKGLPADSAAAEEFKAPMPLEADLTDFPAEDVPPMKARK